MAKRPNNFPTGAMNNVEPSEIGKIVSIMDSLRKMKPVSKRNPEEIQERITEYLKVCSENEIRPTVEGMALSLGVTRAMLWKWEQDEGSEAGKIVSRAKELINAMITTLSCTGKINPMYGIWLQKNHFGYSDTKTIELKSANDNHQDSIEEQLDDAGLIWDDELQEFVPRG